MTWSYSGDPSSSELDEYRFLISDTNEKEPLLKDAEIEYILQKYSEKHERLYRLYDRAAEIISSKVKRSLGPLSEDMTARLQFYRDKAEYFRSKRPRGFPKVPKGCPSFYKGMHDNV